MSFQQSSEASTIYPKMQNFSSMRSTPCMEIDDKGGEIVQRYKSFEIEIEQGGEISFGKD